MKDQDIINLESTIKLCAQKYYSGYPIISDNEFDNLVEQLRNLDPYNELLTKTGWGFDPTKVEYGKKVNHIYQEVGSISNKPRKVEDIPDNLKSSNTSVRISAKLDGLSCVLYYKDGEMYQALTRGNGIVGVDVTNKIHYILRENVRYRNIPGFTGAIRGELVISNKNWEKIPASQDPSKNPRNYASGLINRHEISGELKYVDLVVYKIIAWENCKEYVNVFNITEKLNCYFEHVVDELTILNGEKINHELLEKLYKEFSEKYPCDGCVITNNNIKYNPKSPDFIYDEVAYKFESEKAITTIDHIEWNLSRTGMIKPVACINPVNIAGSTVSRCTCFNAQFVIDNMLGRGAVIEIEKSGEIIPDLQRVIKQAEVAEIPSVCPRCGEELELIGKELKCTNSNCIGSARADLQHWTAVLAPVDNLGGKIKDNFFDDNGFETVEDLYKRLPMMVFGESATDKKLMEMTDKVLYKPIDAVSALVALNIPRLGWKSAEKIVQVGLFGKLADSPEVYRTELFDEFINELEKVVGQATRKSIESNMNKIMRLRFLKGRVIVKSKSVESIESKGDICITGKLSMKRSDFEEIIKKAGYNPVGKVNKDTVYLITDNPNGSSNKNKVANELGISKISESEFMEMINNE